MTAAVTRHKQHYRIKPVGLIQKKTHDTPLYRFVRAEKEVISCDLRLLPIFLAEYSYHFFSKRN
jgi:hypothetical protein